MTKLAREASFNISSKRYWRIWMLVQSALKSKVQVVITIENNQGFIINLNFNQNLNLSFTLYRIFIQKLYLKLKCNSGNLNMKSNSHPPKMSMQLANIKHHWMTRKLCSLCARNPSLQNAFLLLVGEWG